MNKISPHPHTQREGWRTELHEADFRVIVYPGSDSPPSLLGSGALGDAGRCETCCDGINHLGPEVAYLALITKCSPFQERVFCCLEYGRLELPISYTPGRGYHLSVPVQTEWLQTFGVIRRTANWLGGIAKSGIPKQRPSRWPEQYGFTRCYATREDAREAAFAAQQAFIPWIAYATFFVGVILFEQQHGIAPHHEWRYRLRKAMQFDEAWGVAMEGSSVFDSGVERLGGHFFIGRETRTQVLEDELVMLEVLRDFGAPIYLDWGSALDVGSITGLRDERQNPLYAHMRPSRRDIKLLLASYSVKREEKAESGVDVEVDADYVPLPIFGEDEDEVSGDSLPQGIQARLTRNGRVVYRAVEAGATTGECPSSEDSRQVTAHATNIDSPQGFFDRRAVENEKRGQREDTKQRQRRVGKERAAHGVKPIKNASFFLWREVAGVWVREELDREDGTEIFVQEDFTRSQTVYDGFANSYDFCGALDPSAVSVGALRDEETMDIIEADHERLVVDGACVDPRAFWAQRVADFVRLEALETPAERESRCRREGVSGGSNCPDSDAGVFVWEIRDSDGSLRETLPAVDSPDRERVRWVRKQVAPCEVQDYMRNAASTHIRFDPFRNEWDISWAFDPTCVARGVYRVCAAAVDGAYECASSVLRDGVDGMEDEGGQEQSLEYVPFFDEDKTLDDLGWTSLRYLDLAHVNGPVNGEGLLREFFEIFGMIATVQVETRVVEGAQLMERIKPLLEVAGFCRFKVPRSFSDAWLSSEQWNTLLYAFERLQWALPERLAELDGTLPQIVDLANMGSVLFQSIGFRIVRASFADDVAQTQFWLIEAPSRPGRPRWQLAIPLARTVVMILRMGWGPDPGCIVVQLIRRCIPFFWLVHAKEAVEHPAIRPMDNGYRASKYVPTKQDFLSAEMNKIEFLRGARGYAAFFAGGLCARWANEYGDVGKMESGPEADALWPGRLRRLCVSGRADVWVYDPSLTQAEVETLVGAVQLIDDSTARDSSANVKSWWPSPQVWNVKLIAPGMWGVAAEEWLRNRRRGLMTETPKWNSNSEWRIALRQKAKVAVAYSKAYDACCMGYMDVVGDLIRLSDMDDYLVS